MDVPAAHAIDWDTALAEIGVRTIRAELKIIQRSTSGLKGQLMERIKLYYTDPSHAAEWPDAYQRLTSGRSRNASPPQPAREDSAGTAASAGDSASAAASGGDTSPPPVTVLPPGAADATGVAPEADGTAGGNDSRRGAADQTAAASGAGTDQVAPDVVASEEGLSNGRAGVAAAGVDAEMKDASAPNAESPATTDGSAAGVLSPASPSSRPVRRTSSRSRIPAQNAQAATASAPDSTDAGQRSGASAAREQPAAKARETAKAAPEPKRGGGTRPSTLESRQRKAAIRAATSTQTPGGAWLDARGRRICGKFNKFELPCGRVGKICPFHGPIAGGEDSEDDQPAPNRQPRESREQRDLRESRERLGSRSSSTAASSRSQNSEYLAMSTGAGDVLSTTSAIPEFSEGGGSVADFRSPRPRRAAQREERQQQQEAVAAENPNKRKRSQGYDSRSRHIMAQGLVGPEAQGAARMKRSRRGVQQQKLEEEAIKRQQKVALAQQQAEASALLALQQHLTAAETAATSRTTADHFLFLASLELDRARAEERHIQNLEELMSESRRLVSVIQENDREVEGLEAALAKKEEQIAAVEAANVPAELIHDWSVLENLLFRPTLGANHLRHSQDDGTDTERS